jgi:hypothetical protein
MRSVLSLISLLLTLPTVTGAQQPMSPPAVSPFADQTTWLLIRPFQYQILDTGLVIDVPAGFVTDFASIPRPLWALASPHGFYSRASIIHDFLYWDQRCTREQADRIMLIAMQESAVRFAERQAIYAGARDGGQSSWDDNTTARAQGMFRTVPAQMINQVTAARYMGHVQGSPDEAGCEGAAPRRRHASLLLGRQVDSRCGPVARPCGDHRG